MPKQPIQAPCFCGAPESYATCCQPYHAGTPAPSAQALMRSRYAAYVLNLHEYIRHTWHSSTVDKDFDNNDEHTNIKWLGLSIQKAWSVSAEEAFVEFIARYKIGGQRAEKLHETSRFVCENGLWFYVDGVFT